MNSVGVGIHSVVEYFQWKLHWLYLRERPGFTSLSTLAFWRAKSGGSNSNAGLLLVWHPFTAQGRERERERGRRDWGRERREEEREGEREREIEKERESEGETEREADGQQRVDLSLQ